MEMNHRRRRQQPCDFFNLFSESRRLNEENYNTHKGLQKSSSSANILVSTELSLSSTFSSSVPSIAKTRTSKHTHQYFSIRNTNTTKTKPSKPSSYNYSNLEKGKTHRKGNMTQYYSPSGSSTTLKLYDDPWKIKKVLTASDLGKLNRLLLSSDDSMEDLLNSVIVLRNNSTNYTHHHHHDDDEEEEEEEEELPIMGREVRVWDVETKSTHHLILKRWASFKNYVLIGDWNQDFVKRRALKKGDEIGFQWDPYNLCFNFSVLKRVTI